MRAGVHAKEGETASTTPISGWSNFMAQAYILGALRNQLRCWLDQPWGRGDLYAIQKIVATIHAQDSSTLTPPNWLPIVRRDGPPASTPTLTNTPTPMPTPTNTPTLTNTPGWGTYSLRFYGTDTNDIERVKTQIINTLGTSLPVNIGAIDFTIEFWLRFQPGHNTRVP